MSAATRTLEWTSARQGQCVELADIPVIPSEEFADHLILAHKRQGRLVQLFGRRMPDGGVTLYSFVANDNDGTVGVCCSQLVRSDTRPLRYHSITAHWPAAQAFEREIA